MIKAHYLTKAVTSVYKQVIQSKKLNTQNILSLLSHKKTVTQSFLTIVFLILENEDIQKSCITFLNFRFFTQKSSICVIQEANIMKKILYEKSF